MFGTSPSKDGCIAISGQYAVYYFDSISGALRVRQHVNGPTFMSSVCRLTNNGKVEFIDIFRGNSSHSKLSLRICTDGKEEVCSIERLIAPVEAVDEIAPSKGRVGEIGGHPTFLQVLDDWVLFISSSNLLAYNLRSFEVVSLSNVLSLDSSGGALTQFGFRFGHHPDTAILQLYNLNCIASTGVVIVDLSRRRAASRCVESEHNILLGMVGERIAFWVCDMILVSMKCASSG